MLHLSSTYILVNDIDRSAEFYSKLFGAKPTVITPDRWLQFDFDGNSLAICNQLFDFKTIAGGGDLDSIYSKAFISRLSKHRTIFGNNIVHKFQTDDLSKEHSRISAIHGGIVSDILYVNLTSPYSFFTVADPDGNVIEIFGDYAMPKQQEVASKDKEINLKATTIEKTIAVEPVPEKPAAVEIIPEKPAAVEPVPDKPAAVEIIPEKPAAVEPVPEKPAAVEPVLEKPTAPEPEPEIPELAPPTIEKTFKDKSILKAAIEKEKETKAVIQTTELLDNETDDQTDVEPVFISPNWEEIADRLKKTVIEKTVRPGSAVKEKEPKHVKQADAEPVKKVTERPALRPIIAEEKSLVLEEETGDSPAVMTPIWDEAYVKSKAPAFEKANIPTTGTIEPESKLNSPVEEAPFKQPSPAEEKPIEPETLKIEEPPVLPPIVAKNIRHAAAVKEPEMKPEKHPAEKPIFKPLAKEKEKEKEREKEKEKTPEKAKRPIEDNDKPMPLPPPIWEKPSADLWGDERK